MVNPAELVAVLRARDLASPELRNMGRTLRETSTQLRSIGMMAVALGAGFSAAAGGAAELSGAGKELKEKIEGVSRAIGLVTMTAGSLLMLWPNLKQVFAGIASSVAGLGAVVGAAGLAGGALAGLAGVGMIAWGVNQLRQQQAYEQYQKDMRQMQATAEETWKLTGPFQTQMNYIKALQESQKWASLLAQTIVNDLNRSLAENSKLVEENTAKYGQGWIRMAGLVREAWTTTIDAIAAEQNRALKTFLMGLEGASEAVKDYYRRIGLLRSGGGGGGSSQAEYEAYIARFGIRAIPGMYETWKGLNKDQRIEDMPGFKMPPGGSPGPIAPPSPEPAAFRGDVYLDGQRVGKVIGQSLGAEVASRSGMGG